MGRGPGVTGPPSNFNLPTSSTFVVVILARLPRRYAVIVVAFKSDFATPRSINHLPSHVLSWPELSRAPRSIYLSLVLFAIDGVVAGYSLRFMPGEKCHLIKSAGYVDLFMPPCSQGSTGPESKMDGDTSVFGSSNMKRSSLPLGVYS